MIPTNQHILVHISISMLNKDTWAEVQDTFFLGKIDLFMHSKIVFTANQNHQALTQQENSILPLTPFKLKLEAALCNLKMYMYVVTIKYKWIGEVNFKVEAVCKFGRTTWL